MWSKREIALTDNARTVLQRRYLLKDKQGREIETERELFVRVARFIAEADRRYGADDTTVDQAAATFFNMMASLDFLPNSPTLMNAGRDLGQLSACFVLPVEDSMEAIFETNKQAALIHKSGGGTGFSFSRLRPRNAQVASTSGVASGPVSFMEVFDASTDAVKQGGTRRGANMGILRVDHPDILEFIACKDRPEAINNFNISVALTDSFMDALKNEADYPLINPQTGQPHTVDRQGQLLNAADVFDQIVAQAWQTGEPGVIFIDRMNRLNPTYPREQIEATNPCGEQPLPPYDSCNLGSINLSRFVKDPLPPEYEPGHASDGVDWERLAVVVRQSVHFLDNVIDQNRYPLEEIKAQSLKNRRIGLGVMGWADLLILLRLPYDAPAAVALGEQMMEFIRTEARQHSSELAKGRGKFPNWEHSIFATENVAMRNATVTTVAPTGTISIIAGCSSGIEPYYSLAYERNVLNGTRLTEVNRLFAAVARAGQFQSEALTARIASRRSIADLEEIPETVRALFLTAADVASGDHIRMQAAFQKHCDSSVSKTINLPQTAGKEEVAQAFRLAFELGCKGVTIYRDHSRPDQVLAPLSSKKSPGSPPSSLHPVAERPRTLNGFTDKIRTGYGNLYVTVNVKEGQPFEVFAHIGKSGYSTMADTEAICRLISLALRSGIPIGQIIRQLRNIGGSSPVFSDGAKVSSIPDGIAQVLLKHFDQNSDQTGPRPADSSKSLPPDICPACTLAMDFDAGCYFCRSCGYSTC